jgi:hypothetical protein
VEDVVPLELGCPPAARPEPGCAIAIEVESASTAASTIFVVFMLLSFLLNMVSTEGRQ